MFRSFVGKLLPKSDARNDAGAPAYALPAKHALAQYAVTGCFNSSFYASADAQLAQVIDLAYAVEPEFVVKTAIYSRERGYMKDMPALLLACCRVMNEWQPIQVSQPGSSCLPSSAIFSGPNAVVTTFEKFRHHDPRWPIFLALSAASARQSRGRSGSGTCAADQRR